jgi:hypothetical protein
MTIDAATAATLKHGSAGPKTEAGKAKSSRNSIRTGLYAARDFVRPEEEEYAQTLIKLMDELNPENSVEQTFATEIMGATWRLRRCRLVEEAQSHLILRRSLDELRKLQKGRTIQEQTADQNPNPKPAPQPPPNADHQLAQRYRESGLSSFCNPVGQVPDLPSTKPAISNKIPRNAPCPCKSGAKYKKCCGGPAATA